MVHDLAKFKHTTGVLPSIDNMEPNSIKSKQLESYAGIKIRGGILKQENNK
jgi:hypothetical protein